MERIDNPLDAAYSQNREEPENVAGELAVTFKSHVVDDQIVHLAPLCEIQEFN
jgi:hypothetical protein